jgi:Leucine Rich repeats (2 copies)
MFHPQMPEEKINLIKLLCTGTADNIALAQTLAKGLGLDLKQIVRKAGFGELRLFEFKQFMEVATGKFTGRNIDSLRKIGYFPHLTVLNCENNKLQTLNGIAALDNLTELNLNGNRKLSDASALQSLKHLQRLELKSCALENLDFLNADFKLQYLNLDMNFRLKTLAGIEAQPSLTHLDCDAAELFDLSPLADLPNLEVLSIRENHIKDLSPLYACKQLNTLYCRRNPLPQEEVERFESANPNCRVAFY